MKHALVILTVLMLMAGMVFSQEHGGRGGRGGEMDEERINQIAERMGVTPEEVRERMAQFQRDREAGGGGRGGQPGGQPGGGRGGQQPQQQDTTVAMATTDQYLFVVKGNYVYQFDINTMELKNKVALEPEKEKKRNLAGDALRQQVETAKKRIEQLHAEGKHEEAEKLEQKLEKMIQKARQLHGDNMNRGGRPPMDGPPPHDGPAPNDAGEVLF